MFEHDILFILHLDVLQKIGQSSKQNLDSGDSHYRQIFRLKVVHLIALFSFAYVGAEITMGGKCIECHSHQPLINNLRMDCHVRAQ